MPSRLHEMLLLLCRNQPSLAAKLARDALHVELPEYTEARIDSADLTDIQPAEYRADLVVLLLNSQPVLGIVVEVQLSRDEDKEYAWPVYAVNLRARIRCPVCLFVLTETDEVARWAAKPIELGGGNRFKPWVLGLSGVPEVTDEGQARVDPELAVLSAMAHGKDPDTDKAVKIALAAQMASVGLDAERSTLYFDTVLDSLNEAALQALKAMDPKKYEYRSDFARQYFGQGKVEGRAEGKVEGKVEGKAEGIAAGIAEGKAELVLKLLARRYGPLAADVEAHIRSAGSTELDNIAERIFQASTLAEVLAAH